MLLGSSQAELQVSTAHAFTGRMCAASRHIESRRSDSLFEDPLGAVLAGTSGMEAPMGEWILVPRTRYGDDVLVERYKDHGARQLVLLGAGMDARAYRHFAATPSSSAAEAIALPELRVFEIDQPTTFDVKEELLRERDLTVMSRHAISHDFAQEDSQGWAAKLVGQGFDVTVPTVWLLEGLLYYLSHTDVAHLMHQIGALSAVGSVVFHDAVTASYVQAGISPGGAPFISGSDDYARLWSEHGGFASCSVRNFKSLSIDRRARCLARRDDAKTNMSARPEDCRGRNLVLFVEAEKEAGACKLV